MISTLREPARHGGFNIRVWYGAMKNRTCTSLVCKGVLIPSLFWLLKVGVSVVRKSLPLQR